MSGRSRFPFTASQWQELEHQALIFKYMASGIPVPPDLLFTIKRSCLDSSSVLPSKLFPTHHPQHVGWNCFQMGLGRKIDPEPGRCRRTDGKKWRCSKEAFPDSKYCERHMHRGKNRSRKPVEVLNVKSSSVAPTTQSTISSLTPKNNNFSIVTSNSNTTTSTQTPNSNNLQYPFYNNTHVLDHHSHHHHHGNPLVYHHQHSTSSSLRPHHGILGLSSQDSNSTSMLFDSDLRSRYVYGMKEEVDHDYGHHDHGHAFFSEEPSRSSVREDHDSWQLTPVLTMSCSSSSSSKQRSSCSGNLQLQSAKYYKNERKEEEIQKTIHFFDEWPVVKDQKGSSWLDLDDNKSSNSGSVSTTQLSISIPNTNSSYDFPIFSSRTTHHGD